VFRVLFRTEDPAMTVLLSPTDIAPAVASRMVAEGTLRRLGRGIVTDEDGPLDDVVARHLHELVARLLPGAVISGRCARSGGLPLAGSDGTRILTIVHPTRRRDLVLPGHLVMVSPGPGPVDGDAVHRHEGLWLASTARALVENVAESHARLGRPSRTLTRPELEEWVDDLTRRMDADRIARLRDDVERMAGLLDAPKESEVVSTLIGAAQGTRPDAHATSDRLRARRAGEPVDPRRLALFDALVATLRARAPEPRPTTPAGEARRATLPFFEAYFSNFIEGTEFAVEEAAAIVFDGSIPAARPEDAHDVLGTYRLVSDTREMRRVPSDGDELIDVLRARHAVIMGARSDKRPGAFKTVANRVGAHVFVTPDEVVGTLREGWRRVRMLDDPFARAVVAMFVIAEVHPFDDGNGRVARVMMNAELSAAGEGRIVIPTVFRNNYLAGLRGMSANGRAEGMVATLAFAQRWTSQVDWSTVEIARGTLDATNALLDPDQADAEGIRLTLPDPLVG
jgi:hypothetical protein